MIIRFVLLFFSLVLLLSCKYVKPNSSISVLNVIYKNDYKTAPFYDYTLTQAKLKTSIQAQISDTNINAYGDCITPVKISLEPGDTILMPFFGRYFHKENIRFDARCVWYAPIRINIKKDIILFQNNPITLDSLTQLLQTDHNLFFDMALEDQRINIHWDNKSSITNRKAILKLITTVVGNIYTEIAKTKFNKSINELNTEEIASIKRFNFRLYHSFNRHIKFKPPLPLSKIEF